MKVHELFAYLCVDNSEKAIEFYTKALSPKKSFGSPNPAVGPGTLSWISVARP